MSKNLHQPTNPPTHEVEIIIRVHTNNVKEKHQLKAKLNKALSDYRLEHPSVYTWGIRSKTTELWGINQND